GLAKQSDLASADSETPTASRQQHLTKSGSTIGTVVYMSPEQARGKDNDSRSDLFSFGAVLYEMATGHLPFRGQTMGEVLEGIFRNPRTAKTRLNAKFSVELDRIIMKVWKKAPGLRYQSAGEMRADLHRLRLAPSSPTFAFLTKPPGPATEVSGRKWIWIGV